MSASIKSGLIKTVSIVSTGTEEIHPEHAFGTHKPAIWWILTCRRWLSRPINVYVIEHSNGLVLFDTGQDRASVIDPNYYPRGFLGFIYHRVAKFHISPADTLTEQLKILGYSITDVVKVVLSHLHQDHIGGLRELAHADIVVSKPEWEAMLKHKVVARGILRKHVDIPGLKWNRVSFQPTDDPMLAPFTESFDLMGDRSLTLLFTPGHTPGSLSMLVRRGAKNPLLLVGDLSFDAEAMEQGCVPGIGDRKQLRNTSAKVLKLKNNLSDLIILPTHDPGAAERLHNFGGFNRS